MTTSRRAPSPRSPRLARTVRGGLLCLVLAATCAYLALPFTAGAQISTLDCYNWYLTICEQYSGCCSYRCHQCDRYVGETYVETVSHHCWTLSCGDPFDL